MLAIYTSDVLVEAYFNFHIFKRVKKFLNFYHNRLTQHNVRYSEYTEYYQVLSSSNCFFYSKLYHNS